MEQSFGVLSGSWSTGFGTQLAFVDDDSVAYVSGSNVKLITVAGSADETVSRSGLCCF